VNDIVHGKLLVSGAPTSEIVIADKGYDSQALRQYIRKQGGISVIPRRSNNKKVNDDMDWALYRYRHLVENVFAPMKYIRAITTGDNKLERNYFSMVALAFAIIWLPMWVD